MKCEVCGREVDLPFQCSYCGKPFCLEHRLPESHQCSSLPQEPFWYQKRKPIRTMPLPPPEASTSKSVSNFRKALQKKPRIRNFITSLKLWFPLFWLVVVLLFFMEADNPAQFYEAVPDMIHYLLFAFASVTGLLSGYKVFKKCDYNPRSDAGIFGLKLLSVGILAVSFFVLFFGIYLVEYTGFFMEYEFWKVSLARETMGIFFITLSLALIVLSGYLLFKFQRRSGIIVYRR